MIVHPLMPKGLQKTNPLLLQLDRLGQSEYTESITTTTTAITTSVATGSRGSV